MEKNKVTILQSALFPHKDDSHLTVVLVDISEHKNIPEKYATFIRNTDFETEIEYSFIGGKYHDSYHEAFKNFMKRVIDERASIQKPINTMKVGL